MKVVKILNAVVILFYIKEIKLAVLCDSYSGCF